VILYGIGAVVAIVLPLVSALHNVFSGLILIPLGGAAWIGIRQLQRTQFASVCRTLLGEKFRRIIDVETRIADFEVSLTRAISMEECWAHIRKGRSDFGFHEVRMSLCGRIFEDICSGPAKPRWQLRIPLHDSQWVNFYRDFDSNMNPIVLIAFVEAVQRGLKASSRQSSDLTRKLPERYHSAAAGAGDLKRVTR
jgi:hypothetical protein